MTDTLTTADCGHAIPHGGIGTGYARTADGRTLCYACADDAQREEMRTAQRFFAYLGTPANPHSYPPVVTWSGGKLGSVTYLNRNDRQTFVRVRDVHGNMWAGIGPAESGTYVSLRRIKSVVS